MPFIRVSDTASIYYESCGEGPPLIFVHGWSLSGLVWKDLVNRFVPGYRLVTVDMRGHGRSSAAATGYEMHGFTSDLKELFEVLELTDATLVGWSLGALVSLAAHPILHDRLASLVLVSGTPKFTSSDDFQCGLPTREPRGLLVRLKRDPGHAFEGFQRSMFTDEEYSDSRVRQMLKDCLPAGACPDLHAAARSLETLVSSDLRDLLPVVKVPVLLVHGSRDKICLPEASRYMAERIKGSTLRMLEGAGHAPMLSRPGELAREIGGFVEGVYAGD